MALVKGNWDFRYKKARDVSRAFHIFLRLLTRDASKRILFHSHRAPLTVVPLATLLYEDSNHIVLNRGYLAHRTHVVTHGFRVWIGGVRPHSPEFVSALWHPSALWRSANETRRESGLLPNTAFGDLPRKLSIRNFNSPLKGLRRDRYLPLRN